MKAVLKTKKTEINVEKFIENIEPEILREDSKIVLDLFIKATKENPKIWGTNIIGFGDIYLKYASGRELDWFKMGFSPKKQGLTFYLHYGFDKYKSYLDKLGKSKMSGSCLIITKLSNIDIEILKELIEKVWAEKENMN